MLALVTRRARAATPLRVPPSATLATTATATATVRVSLPLTLPTYSDNNNNNHTHVHTSSTQCGGCVGVRTLMSVASVSHPLISNTATASAMSVTSPVCALVSVESVRTYAASARRHKKWIKQAKGARGRAKNCYTIARRLVEKKLQYQYRDRRVKKRVARRDWIARINAGTRQHNLSYSQFVLGLNELGIKLNRKVLAELAINEPISFYKLVELAKSKNAELRESGHAGVHAETPRRLGVYVPADI